MWSNIIITAERELKFHLSQGNYVYIFIPYTFCNTINCRNLNICWFMSETSTSFQFSNVNVTQNNK